MFSPLRYRRLKPILAILFRLFGLLLPNTLCYLCFWYFDIDLTWWSLFQKRACAPNLISTFSLEKITLKIQVNYIFWNLNKKAHLLKYIVLKYKVLIIKLKTIKCYTIRTVLKCNRNIVAEEAKSIPLTHIYMIDHFQLMSIGVKMILCVQISPFFHICFCHM
jgi:hypothetical protein